jgi:protein-disulfide isomerase
LRRTRRQFLLTASSFVLAAALAGGGLEFFHRTSALAQSAVDELMQAGPLGEAALGADNAPVTIIEYASMTCPHCAHFAVTTFPQLKEKYIDTGKVRFILREFPFDPIAAGAFMIARCAGKDSFFPVVEVLFRNQAVWAHDDPFVDFVATLKQAGISEDKVKECLADQKAIEHIEWVRKRAIQKFRVDSTPTFFIDGQKQTGALSFEDMQKLIEPILTAQAKP